MAPMTPERLAVLAAARQKALEKKRLLGELARKEREVRDKSLRDRLDAANKALAGDAAPEDAKQEKKTPKETKKPSSRKKPPPSCSESDASSDSAASSESDAEEEAAPSRPAEKQRKYRPSSAAAKATSGARLSSRPQAELTAAIAREELQRRIERENYDMAFQSILPGYRLYR
jgi:hypothetical protein